MTTRWWSILLMLQSIIKSKQPIVLALANANKKHLILDGDEINKVNEIIQLLEHFKLVGEVLGKESGVTISSIVPMFALLKDTVLINSPSDSAMLRDMKRHMLSKLSSRYSQDQQVYLTSVAYLDPRFKGSVTPGVNLEDLKSRVKTIVEQTGITIVSPTQNQGLDDRSL